MSTYEFPDGFVWGAGTSAYQSEGSPLADGAGPSLLHTWAKTPGNVVDGVTGDVLADHYRRYREDVAIMRELGLPTYLFTTSWARILPDGSGTPNTAALDFYDRLADACLEAGVAPAVGLHVFDPPVAVQNRGGWLNRDAAEWFGEYAALVFERLGDRVTHWITMCEPNVVMHFGHVTGATPPHMRDLQGGLLAGHHMLLAHGRAVQAHRAGGAGGEIGNMLVLGDVRPATDDAADVAAADRVRDWFNRWFLDPVLRGAYPQQLWQRFGDAVPAIRPGDMETIATPMDFVGVDYYYRWVVSEDSDGAEGGERWIDNPDAGWSVGAGLRARVAGPAGAVTGIGWDDTPDGLTEVLRWLREDYDDPPIYVTEIGAAYDDVVTDDGRVHDAERTAFLRSHVVAAHRALADGVDLRGLFVWSFLDTWEFALGVTGRFGLVHVDYATQRRTIKDSGFWFRDVVAANGVTPDGAEAGA